MSATFYAGKEEIADTIAQERERYLRTIEELQTRLEARDAEIARLNDQLNEIRYTNEVSRD